MPIYGYECGKCSKVYQVHRCISQVDDIFRCLCGGQCEYRYLKRSADQRDLLVDNALSPKEIKRWKRVIGYGKEFSTARELESAAKAKGIILLRGEFDRAQIYKKRPEKTEEQQREDIAKKCYERFGTVGNLFSGD